VTEPISKRRTFTELLIDCEEDRTLRAVLVWMLGEAARLSSNRVFGRIGSLHGPRICFLEVHLHTRPASCVHGAMEAQSRQVKTVRDVVDPDEASFEAFFDAEWPRLFRALLLLTGNAHEAEDLTQGAFLKLLERWDALDHGTDLQGYLFRTALNTYRSLYRRSRLAAKRVLAPGQAGTDPFEEVAERESAVRLLLGLTQRQRAAIVLTGIEGFDYRQAGAMLGVNESTVRSLVSQARARFAKGMDDSDE
jgi:RNA polymerase sigma factor (sigma-70 family)